MRRRVIKSDWDNARRITYYICVAFLVLPLVLGYRFKDGLSLGLVLYVLIIVVMIIGYEAGYEWGFNIDYVKEIVKYKDDYTTVDKGKCTIRISDIDHVELQELQAERKRIYIFIFDDYLFPNRGTNIFRDCVYRNGKLFYIVVYKKDGTEIKYPYTVMYQARSKKRVMKHEAKMRAILDELNAYIASNDRWHSIMSEI